MKAIFFAIAVIVGAAHADDLRRFNATFMVPGYCQAGSREDDKALGDYGGSPNVPKKLGDSRHGIDGEVSLIAFPHESVPFATQFLGFRLLLINRTKTEVAFPACSSRLPVICEARDDDGRWMPIEYLPWSSCGNSYHEVFLPAGHYWEFAAPTYSGTTKTKLRFKLETKQPIYSNEFDGFVSALQFISPPPPRRL